MADKSKVRTWGEHSRMSVDGTTMFCTDPGTNITEEMSKPWEEGMTGRDQPTNDGRRLRSRDVKANPVIQPSYAHANLILQAFFDETAGTFTPADDPVAAAAQAALVYYFGPSTYTFAAMWLAELEIKGERGKELDWTLRLLGTTYSAAGSVAALTVPKRMLFSDLTAGVTVDADNYFPNDFTWKFGYGFDDSIFRNSLTRQTVSARMKYCNLTMGMDLNSDTFADIYALAGTDTALGGTNGVILPFTDGTSTLDITMPEMVVMNKSKLDALVGSGAQQAPVELMATLKSGQTDIVSIDYAAS